MGRYGALGGSSARSCRRAAFLPMASGDASAAMERAWKSSPVSSRSRGLTLRSIVRVCNGESTPSNAKQRLWLLGQLVCRYQRSVDRAARATLAEHDAFAPRAENEALKAKNDLLEQHCVIPWRQLEQTTADRPPSICNVVNMSPRCRGLEVCGPMPAWRALPIESTRPFPPCASFRPGSEITLQPKRHGSSFGDGPPQERQDPGRKYRSSPARELGSSRSSPILWRQRRSHRWRCR